MRNRKPHSRSGSILVEFALVVPMFLLLCVASIDFSRVFYATMVLSGATRAGVEYAAQNAHDTPGVVAAVSIAAGRLRELNVTATPFCTCSAGGPQVSCSNSCSGRATYIQITASAPFKTISPWPVIPNSITLSNTGTVRVQ
jgi:Flp pilus assembly protein TadG